MEHHLSIQQKNVAAAKQQQDLLKLVNNPISDRIVPVKLLPDSIKFPVEWKCKRSMHETTLENTIETQCSNQTTTTTTTRLTQFGQQANLKRDCACQIIAGQTQVICIMEMQMEHEMTLEQKIEKGCSNQTTTRLTQVGQQANLGWDCACQAIAVQPQVICRMEMQMEHEMTLEQKIGKG